MRRIADATCIDATLQNKAGGANDGNRPIGGYLTQGDPRSVWLPMTTDF